MSHVKSIIPIFSTKDIGHSVKTCQFLAHTHTFASRQDVIDILKQYTVDVIAQWLKLSFQNEFVSIS